MTKKKTLESNGIELPKLYLLLIPSSIFAALTIASIIASGQIETWLFQFTSRVIPVVVLIMILTSGYTNMGTNKIFDEIMKKDLKTLPTYNKGSLGVLVKASLPVGLLYIFLIIHPYHGLIQMGIVLLLFLFITVEIFRAIRASIYSKMIYRLINMAISDIEKEENKEEM